MQISKTSTKLAELLTSYRGKSAQFAEDLLTWQGKPVKLFPYQREYFDVDFYKDHTTLLKARQCGGSFCCSLNATAWACCWPYSGIFICSRTEDQASIIFQYLRTFLEDSPILRTLIVPNTAKQSRKSTTDEIYLRNGSRIICRSLGLLDAATIRGWGVSLLGRYGCLCYDEAAYLPEKGVAASLMSAAGGHGLHMVSSAKAPSGAFYRACQSDQYRHFHWPARKGLQAGRFTPSDVDLWKATLTPAEYQREVEARFARGQENVFDPDDIERAIDPDLPVFGKSVQGDSDKTYIFAIDTSMLEVDRFVLLIGEIRNGILYVVAIHSWAGTAWKDVYEECEFTDSLEQILRQVYEYHKAKDFSCFRCYVDATSNLYWANALTNQYLMNVEPVKWSTGGKEKLISHLNACLKAGRIRIPNSEILRGQLLDFSFDLKKMQDGSNKTLYMAGEDDYVAALAMLAQSITVAGEKVKPILRWK